MVGIVLSSRWWSRTFSSSTHAAVAVVLVAANNNLHQQPMQVANTNRSAKPISPSRTPQMSLLTLANRITRLILL